MLVHCALGFNFLGFSSETYLTAALPGDDTCLVSACSMHEYWVCSNTICSSTAAGELLQGLFADAQMSLVIHKTCVSRMLSPDPPVKGPILAISVQGRQQSDGQCHALLNSVSEQGLSPRYAQP